MIDFDAPSSARAIDSFKTGDTHRLLVHFAAQYKSVLSEAEDLVADAIACVCDPEDGRPWDPIRATFLTHMRIVIRDLAHRERRSARARRECVGLPPDEEITGPTLLGDDAENVLVEASQWIRLRALGARLRERIAHNARTAQVFDCACEGVCSAAEVAARIGCTVRDVYASNEQIAYHAQRVLAEERKRDAPMARTSETTTDVECQ